MRKSLGDKRREISPKHIQQIIELFLSFNAGESSKIFDTRDFGYRKITIERPLRLNFQTSPQRIAEAARAESLQRPRRQQKENPGGKSCR